MSFELVVPQLSGKGRTTKDYVIAVLSRDWPLTSKRIYNELRKVGCDVSYQAVHKVIKALTEQEVLVRLGREYKISVKWLASLKSFGEELCRRYESGQKPDVARVFSNGGTADIVFASLHEAYRFIMDVVGLVQDSGKVTKPCVLNLSCMAWVLSGPGRLRDSVRKPSQWERGVFVACRSDTVIDRTMKKLMESREGSMVRIETGVESVGESEIIVAEDMVIQLFMPPEIRERLESIYMESDSPSSLDLLYEALLSRKGRVHMLVTRNQELAEQIRKRTLGYFQL